jgi:small GTP-binding protein
MGQKDRTVGSTAMDARNAAPHIKVVFVGDSGVGKTCLMNALLDLPFDNIHCMTTGPEFRALRYKYKDAMVSIELWDTAGQEVYRSITRMYFRNAQIVLVCYDVGSADSFDHIDRWIELMSNEARMPRVILVGTKKDRQDGARISLSQAKEKADQGGYWFIETSSKTRDGIDGLKDLLGEAALVADSSTAFASRIQVDLSAKSRTESRCC